MPSYGTDIPSCYILLLTDFAGCEGGGKIRNHEHKWRDKLHNGEDWFKFDKAAIFNEIIDGVHNTHGHRRTQHRMTACLDTGHCPEF
jgi:hypothetical protein